eukprot:Em0047g2a
MSVTVDPALFPAEAERYVEELCSFDISDIGSASWFLQRERLEKLAIQAVYNLTQQVDEFVKEFLISHNKIPVLAHELLSVELWKSNVFPLMLEDSNEPKTGFPTYLVLYHEATLVDLLQAALYYQESCGEVEGCIIDLVDYCHRRLTELVATTSTYCGIEEIKTQPHEGQHSIIKELDQQKKDLQFGVCLKAISLATYIVDHLESLPLGVTTRLLNTHDIPCVLVNILQSAPWTRTGDKGETLKYNEAGRWVEVASSERLRLTKTEGQIWLTLYHLLMDPQCQQKYEFNQHNKGCILKLRTYLNEPLLEQIPQLAGLQRYLEQLSFMEPPHTKRDILLEQVPVIYETLQASSMGRWPLLAKRHKQVLLYPTEEDLRGLAKRWVDSCNMDLMEALVTGPPRCALCGQEASKRCSKCKGEWYCGRECQVKHWKKHKSVCELMAVTAS